MSAGGVDQRGSQRAFGQLVVDRHRLAGLGYMHGDATLFQVTEGGRVNLQPPGHVLRQHHGGRATGQELLDAVCQALA